MKKKIDRKRERNNIFFFVRKLWPKCEKGLKINIKNMRIRTKNKGR